MPWHTRWLDETERLSLTTVKLDLEARGLIQSAAESRPQRVRLTA